jgi:uncharacterized protein YkuJ
MRLVKLSLVIALLLSVFFVYAGSTVKVTVKNNTNNGSYTCTVRFCQQDATPTTGSIVFTVPSKTSVTQTYEFDDADICLCTIECKLGSQTPVGFIDVDCGNNTPTIISDVAPVLNPGPPSTYYKFRYTSITYSYQTEDHLFDIVAN